MAGFFTLRGQRRMTEKEEHKKSLREQIEERISQGLTLIVVIAAVLFFISKVAADWPETLLTDTKGNLVLTEAKNFLGLVWFNKKELHIAPTDIMIVSESILSGREIQKIPYSKIKKVTFETGHDSHAIEITSEGGIFDNTRTFHLENLANYREVAKTIQSYCGGQVTLVRKQTLLNRFFGGAKVHPQKTQSQPAQGTSKDENTARAK
jgi:hypothetical protein